MTRTDLPGDPPDEGESHPSARRFRQERLTPRARWMLALLSGAVLLFIAGAVVWSTTLGTQSSRAPEPSRTPTRWRALSEQLPVPGAPADAMDPIRSGCGSPDVVAQVITLDDVAVHLPNGTEFGRLRLRHQAACTASWALVLGPHSPERAVHITAYRPADGVSAPSVYRGEYSSSYGNMLLTTHGCVYVEAYVETPQGRGPTARTRCA
ncbi:hypothetical protein ACFOY2_02555 [Nonomuraea purpurea]|uniref:DUF2690 domain-containing protein n=1 Tax=Nonomuraea purpurea TaxID=1849276 RepID=A0ABV8G0M3_9ACTN